MFSFKKVITVLTILSFSIAVFAQSTKTLDYFLTSARANSPVLNDYNNQRYSLKIDSLKMLADNGLQVTGNIDAMYAPVIKGWGYDNVLSNGQNLTSVIRVSKDLMGRENRNTRLADYSLGIRQLFNQSAVTELQLNRVVAEQYINTYSVQQQYQVSQEIIRLLQEEEIILKKLTKNASFKQTDYLSFVVTLQQNQLTSKQLYADWLSNYATLNYLAGMVDTTLQKIAPPLLSDENFIPFEQSIYAESYQTDSLKLANDTKIIDFDYRPKLSAYADGGYMSSFPAKAYKNLGVSAGLLLTVPIYDGDKRKKTLQQKKLQQETLSWYNKFERKQYEQQTLQIESQISQYKQMIATANEQMKYAQTLIEATLRQLPTGDVKVTDFIVSISNYLNLKSSLIQYEINLYNLYNKLKYITLQ